MTQLQQFRHNGAAKGTIEQELLVDRMMSGQGIYTIYSVPEWKLKVPSAAWVHLLDEVYVEWIDLPAQPNEDFNSGYWQQCSGGENAEGMKATQLKRLHVEAPALQVGVTTTSSLSECGDCLSFCVIAPWPLKGRLRWGGGHDVTWGGEWGPEQWGAQRSSPSHLRKHSSHCPPRAWGIVETELSVGTPLRGIQSTKATGNVWNATFNTIVYWNNEKL